MCGILGSVPGVASVVSGESGVDERLFANALSKLNHRGPNSHGIYHSALQNGRVNTRKALQNGDNSLKNASKNMHSNSVQNRRVNSLENESANSAQNGTLDGFQNGGVDTLENARTNDIKNGGKNSHSSFKNGRTNGLCSVPISLGHTRLSIVDLSSNAAQPMHFYTSNKISFHNINTPDMQRYTDTGGGGGNL